MVNETSRLGLNTYEQGDENWSHTDAVEAVDKHAIKRGPVSDRPDEGEYDDELFAAIDQRIIWRWDESESDWKALSGLGTDGNPVPGASYFESLEADVVTTEDSVSNQLQTDEFSAERFRDVYRSDKVIPLSASTQVSDGVGSNVRNISVQAGVAYTADRNEFAAFDVTDPVDASKLDAIDTDPELDGVNDFVLYGRYAICSTRFSERVTILDISDPSDLSIVSSVEISGEDLYGIAHRETDNTVYVCGREHDSLTAVDISDLLNPIETDYLTDGQLNGSTGVDIINEDYVVLAARDSHSVLTIDASDPSNLSIADQVQDTELLNRADEIIVDRRGVNQDYAYHVGGMKSDPNEYFVSIDISDPTNISIADSVSSTAIDNSGSVGADIQGNYVYVSRRSDGGIVTFDVSDPESIEEVDSIQVGIDSHDCAVEGNLVYDLQPGSNSFRIIGPNQFTTPDTRQFITHVSTGTTKSFSETFAVPRNNQTHIIFEIHNFNIEGGTESLSLEMALEGVGDGNCSYNLVDGQYDVDTTPVAEDEYEIIRSIGGAQSYAGIMELFWRGSRFAVTTRFANTVDDDVKYLDRIRDSSTVANQDEIDVTISADGSLDDETLELNMTVWAADRSGLS